jgi:hypothetical protein
VGSIGRSGDVRRAGPLPKTRQQTRLYLFRVALAEVNKRNSTESVHDGHRCWYNIMPRHERRNLARAFAAGEWRRQSPARGIA